MELAAGEDETRVGGSLHMAAQQRLDIFLGVGGNLLELIDGYQARTVGIVEICEDFLEGECRPGDVTQVDAEGGHSRHGIEAELAGERV